MTISRQVKRAEERKQEKEDKKLARQIELSDFIKFAHRHLIHYTRITQILCRFMNDGQNAVMSLFHYSSPRLTRHIVMLFQFRLVSM